MTKEFSKQSIFGLPTFSPSSPISHQLPAEYFPLDYGGGDNNKERFDTNNSRFELQMNEMTNQVKELKTEIKILKEEFMVHSASGTASGVRSNARQMERYELN
ncbi:284_t:CDS:2 [Diversispora eburnea]|uniref:284_t:CDS:1 n=1 Tax=Diversispora eburnea TaxID=1213867 RepID=A0A9N8YXH3_9GLOM|nr:284_t:CDS:2 [Diversispora eburnea]